jgi:hypothetical protein
MIKIHLLVKNHNVIKKKATWMNDYKITKIN